MSRSRLARSARYQGGWRWCKRNWKIAGLMAAFVLSLVVGAVTATYYAILADSRADNLQASNKKLTAANLREVELTQQATANAEFANRQSDNIMHILENVMLDVADRLKKVPGAQDARREILNQGMNGLELLSDEIRNDSRAKINSVTALVQMGDIYKRIGDEQGLAGSDNAISSLELAASIGEPLLEKFANDNDVKRGMISVFYDLGGLLINTGRLDQASVPAEKGLQLAREMMNGLSDSTERQKDLTNLAAAENQVARLALKQQKYDLAKERFTTALGTATLLANEFPEYRSLELLAKAHEGIGDSLLDGGQAKLSQPHYEKSMKVCQQLVAQEPNAESRWLLAIAYERMGELYRALDRNEEALVAYKKSYEESVPLFEENRDDIQFQLDFAITYCKLAKTYRKLNRSDDVIESYSKALEIRLPISEADPGDLETQRLVINSYQGIGLAMEAKEDFSSAIQSYRTAMEFYQNCRQEAKDYLKRLEDWLKARIKHAQSELQKQEAN